MPSSQEPIYADPKASRQRKTIRHPRYFQPDEIPHIKCKQHLVDFVWGKIDHQSEALPWGFARPFCDSVKSTLEQYSGKYDFALFKSLWNYIEVACNMCRHGKDEFFELFGDIVTRILPTIGDHDFTILCAMVRKNGINATEESRRLWINLMTSIFEKAGKSNPFQLELETALL